MRPRALVVVAAALLAAIAGCKREERVFRVEPPAAERAAGRSLSNLYPGGANPPAPVTNELEENAYAVSEGKALFAKFNCVGCHQYGGGGIGPALMDEKWIYGSNPENVYATIVEGRPNGMPSWRGKIPDYQVWQIVAYVRSLSGQVPKDVPGSRTEDMKTHAKEASPPSASPRPSSEPNPGGGTK